MTYLRSSSSSYHLEIKKAKWRTWNAANEKGENTSSPGNVFDCQHARREPGELQNDLRNLAIPSGIQRREAN